MSIRLDKLITDGRLRDFRLSNGDIVYPPSGKCWMLLTGIIGHVTGTDTSFWWEAHKPYAQHGQFMSIVPSATASGSYPLFRLKAEEQQGAWSPIIMNDEGRMRVAGAATIKVNITVLEWSNTEVQP